MLRREAKTEVVTVLRVAGRGPCAFTLGDSYVSPSEAQQGNGMCAEAPVGSVRDMMRKVLWLLSVVAATSVVLGFVDRHRAKQRRELWAEATDPM